MADRRTQPGFDDGLQRKKTHTVGSSDHQVGELSELEHYKHKRESEVRKNFQRYLTEIVSKESSSIMHRKDSAFFKKLDAKVDRVIEKIGGKQHESDTAPGLRLGKQPTKAVSEK